MPGPFPGMDPFLEEESLWPWFQHQLAITLCQTLVPTASGPRYRVQITTRRFPIGHQEHNEEYLAIRARVDDHLVTVIDIVSPANKLTEPGRRAYLDTRRAAREAGASIVEIDLILRGKPTLDYSREGLPAWDYAVTTVGQTAPDRYEIYTSALEKRLPRFRLPLASDDRDAVLDLQKAFTEAYEACGFASQIDYGREPGVPFSAEVRGRVAKILRERRG
jgi:hypothetical protein